MALPRYFGRWGNYPEQDPISSESAERDITPSQWDSYTPMISEELQTSLDALAENDLLLFQACSGGYPLEVSGYGDNIACGERFKGSKWDPAIETIPSNSTESVYFGLAPEFEGDRRRYLGVDRDGMRWFNTDPANVFITSGFKNDDFGPEQSDTEGVASGARWLKSPVYIPCDSGISDKVPDGYLKITIDGTGYVATPEHFPDPPSYPTIRDPETDPNGCILDVYLNDYKLGSTQFGCQTLQSDLNDLTCNGSLECSFVVKSSDISSGYLSFHKRNEDSEDVKPLYLEKVFVKVDHYGTIS